MKQETHSCGSPVDLCCNESSVLVCVEYFWLVWATRWGWDLGGGIIAVERSNTAILLL